MKKTLIFLLLSVFADFVYSQTYVMGTQALVNACAGDFYDSGDAGGNYNANENLTITFHSTNFPNTHTKMSFNLFDVEPGDTLIVYDGSTTAAPVIGRYNNNILPPAFVKASISNLTGDLTFRFKSNATLNYSGWFASLSCTPQCQDIIAAFRPILTIPHPNDSNYVDICIGSSIQFAAQGSGPGAFPQNDILYHQDSLTSTFIWDFGDGITDTGQIVTHTYTTVRGYDISLIITDSMGCVNSNYLGGRVRISKNPFATINPIPDMCSSTDTSYISVGYNAGSVVVIEPVMAHQSASQKYDSTTFIPDGNYCATQCYNTFVTFNAFATGTTITSANDILSICVNMEHSFAGDLGFTIICPNGQSVNLDPNTHSGGAYLGVPLEDAGYDSQTYPCDPAFNTVGTQGWTYCWSLIYPQHGTFDSLSDGGFGTTMDSTNTINHTNYITPNNSLSGLIGCPLNGTWNIEICDDYSSDNGYIFWWELNLDPSLLPTGWGYTVPIDTVIWSGSFFSIVNDSTIRVVPDSGGIYQYTVTVIDAFGCSYDTTLNLQVVQTPHPDMGNDTTLCGNGTIYMLDAGPGQGWNWSTGNLTQTQPVSATGIFSVDVHNHNTDSTLTCRGADTIFVRVLTLPAAVNLGPDLCSLVPVQLDAGNPSGFQFHWNTNNPGDTTQIITAPISGWYSVTVAEDLGFNCKRTDSVFVMVNPEPTIEIGADTSMCSYAKMHMHVTDVNGYLDNPLYQYTYAWSPFGQNTRDITIECLNSGQTYDFTVAVTGCTTVSKTRKVEARNCELQLPNVITPNGDLKNDIMQITGIENFPGSKLQIYDRWGKKIFESNDYNNNDHAWDGGNAAEGVYYYVLTLNYGTAGDCVGAKSVNGTVTIMK